MNKLTGASLVEYALPSNRKKEKKWLNNTYRCESFPLRLDEFRHSKRARKTIFVRHWRINKSRKSIPLVNYAFDLLFGHCHRRRYLEQTKRRHKSYPSIWRTRFYEFANTKTDDYHEYARISSTHSFPFSRPHLSLHFSLFVFTALFFLALVFCLIRFVCLFRLQISFVRAN